MAASIKTIFRASLVGAALLSATIANAQSAPSAVPVPFSVAFAGTGVAGMTTCTTGIATTSGVSYGDGCAANTAGLAAPQGAAVDKFGNVYVADYTDRLVRVIYNGGANLAAAITAANSGYTISGSRTAPAPTPVAGNIYTIAGLGTTPAALTVTAADSKFECANFAAAGQPEALNSLGDGCPAASAPIGPRDVTIDNDGNLFITDYTNSRIRVLCVNCAAGTLAASLITLEESGVTPVNGAMYTIAGYSVGYRDGYIGFGNATTPMSGVSLLRTPTAAVVSSSDDVFIADNLNNAVRLLYNGGTSAKNILTAQGFTPTLGYVYTIAGAGCVSAPTTKSGSTVSANSCLTTADSDTPTLGNAVGLDVAWTVYLDPNGNVFYTDAGNGAGAARVKFIYGGVAAPVTFSSSTLKTGFTYSFAGQGTLTTSGVAPSQLTLISAQGVGGDANGNIFFMDYTTGLFYETYAQTGLTAIIGGGNAVPTPAVGTNCSSGTAGPAMTDAFYDGCPLTQVKIANPRGPIVADATGNLYFADSVGSLLRKFTYNPTFPATAVASTSAAQAYAFTFISAQTLTAPTFTLSGAAATTYTDAGNDTCTTALIVTGGGPGTTCVVNVAFTPQKPGLAAGAVELNSATGVLGASLFSGTGIGAGLTVDPGTSTTTGTGLIPNAIAVDGAGRVLVADGSSKSVLRYTAGVPTTIATGFTAPSGVAIDGAGTLYVADATANTITEVPITGAKFTLSAAVSNPHGLATDSLGNLYIADTGNNRVLAFGPGATLPTVPAFTGLNAPQAVAVDAAGNIFAADSAHIVKLTPTGVQSTIATSGATGIAVDAAGNVLATAGTTLTEYPAAGSAAIALSNALITPKSLVLDASGNAYIADTGFTGYLELQRTAGAYHFTSSPSNITVNLTSSGNTSLTAPTETQTDSKDFSLAPASTNGCSGALPSGVTCALTASFAPVTAGPLTDIVTFNSNAANSTPITFTLTGTSSAQTTTTTLTASPATLVYGNVETLTATLTGSLTAPTNGTVNFYNNLTTLLGSANVGANSVATLGFLPAVGTYSVTAVYVPNGVAYLTSTSSAMPFSVTPASLTVTANNASKLFNAANPPLTYTITGFVNSDTQAVVSGTPNESTTATIASPSGTYPITITQGTLAAANYTFTFVNGTLSVTGATAQTITFAALPNVTYGVAPITLTATASSGQPVSYTVTGPATINGSTLTITGAGTVSVTANQTGNNTYAAAAPVTHSFTVAPATLTVTATSVSRMYGAANPTLAYTITGFVNTDSQVTATTGAPNESTAATSSSPIGSYPITITQGTLASNNYTFVFTNGTLTVTAAPLTLTANNATRVYGAANPAFSGTISGAVNNDQLTETFSTSATTTSPVGTYAIVPGATGTNVGNYTFASTNGTLTVTQAKPTITLGTSATNGFNGSTNITLTATVISPTSGSPTGTVTFYSSSTPVGTATIAAGVAVFSTTALPIGSDSITAIYAGDTNFSTVTSSSILVTIAAGFSVTASTTTLAFQQNYQEAQAFLTINPGGRTDTITFACSGLPAKLSCAFSPATLPLSGLTAQQTVQLLVSNSGATASLLTARTITLAALPFAAILMLALRRRRLPALLMFALLTLTAATTLTGCGTSPKSLQQGSGSYPFTVTVNSGTSTLQSLSFTVTVP